MRADTHTEIKYMHHRARSLPSLGLWVIVNQDDEIVATVATNTTNHTTELTITLVLGEYKMAPRTLTRPGGMRTALRWTCQELNNSNLWLRARLLLEHEARLLDYDESELLACWHAYEYQYCQRLLANLPGLL